MGRLSSKHLLTIASQTIDVLQHLHKKNYVHSDIKAQNIMIGRYKNSSTPLNKMRQLNEKRDDEVAYKTPKKFNPKTENALKFKQKAHSTPFSGSNPVRSCRMESGQNNSMYEEMVESHYSLSLRHTKPIDYSAFLSDNESTKDKDNYDAINGPERKVKKSGSYESDSDFESSFRTSKKKLKKRRSKKSLSLKAGKTLKQKVHRQQKAEEMEPVKEEQATVVEEDPEDHVYLIDYGLASKFVGTNGEHRPFCMDQRRAHDGTLEFTSRDAHFGAHSRRSDLECLGYNLIYWSQGYLPWKYENMQSQPPELIHRLKEIFMADVKEMMKLFYGKDVPKYLGDFMLYVGNLAYDEEPDYNYLKRLFQQEFSKLGLKKDEMKLNIADIKKNLTPRKELDEMELMIATITDLKMVGKLGFPLTKEGAAGPNVLNGDQAVMTQISQTFNVHSTSKLSPKFLRSKAEKESNKRPKRQIQKEKDVVDGCRTRNGKRLSIVEMVSIDPDQIARDRAEKEYERFDEKLNDQPNSKYEGRPTYAILEIENKIRNKQITSNQNSMDGNGQEKETIKGYTAAMMAVLRKRQLFIEEQIKHDLAQDENNSSQFLFTPTKRNRDGLRNILKQTKRSIIYQTDLDRKNKKKSRKSRKRSRKVAENNEQRATGEETPVKPIRVRRKQKKEKVVEEDIEIPQAVSPPLKKRSKKSKKIQDPVVETVVEPEQQEPVVETVARKRGRPRKNPEITPVVVRKRGRPSKKRAESEHDEHSHSRHSEKELHETDDEKSNEYQRTNFTGIVSRRRPRKSASPKKLTRNLVKSRSVENNSIDPDDNAVDGTFENVEQIETPENDSDCESNANNSYQESEVASEEVDGSEEAGESESEVSEQEKIEDAFIDNNSDNNSNNGYDSESDENEEEFSEIMDSEEGSEEIGECKKCFKVAIFLIISNQYFQVLTMTAIPLTLMLVQSKLDTLGVNWLAILVLIRN